MVQTIQFLNRIIYITSNEFSAYFHAIVTKIKACVVHELIVHEIKDNMDQTHCASINLRLI